MGRAEQGVELYLSFDEFARAVYEKRLDEEDLVRPLLYFPRTLSAIMKHGAGGLTSRLRYTCLMDDDRVAQTYRLLRKVFAKAKKEGRLEWQDPTGADAWAPLNRMLMARGFPALDTTAPFTYMAVMRAVKQRQIPLHVVIVPD